MRYAHAHRKQNGLPNFFMSIDFGVCVLLMMWPAGELLFIVDVRCCRENGALHTCREY